MLFAMPINYPYLPKHHSIHYVGSNHPHIRFAERACRELSSDDQHPTGAVIVCADRVIGRGANQSALRNPTFRLIHKKGLCVRRILGVSSGKKYWLCPGCADYHKHAEAQAVLDAKTRNENMDGSDLYLWGHWWCCKPCWDVMIAAGIRNVYLLDDSEKLFNRK